VYTSFRGIYPHSTGTDQFIYTSFLRDSKLVFSRINYVSNEVKTIQLIDDYTEAGLLDMWDSELRGAAVSSGEARIVTIIVDDDGTFYPISELRNQYMTEILSMTMTSNSYNFEVCGYSLVGGIKRASITRYDALRNA